MVHERKGNISRPFIFATRCVAGTEDRSSMSTVRRSAGTGTRDPGNCAASNASPARSQEAGTYVAL